jgi:deoxyribose-phosphate aldolase
VSLQKKLVHTLLKHQQDLLVVVLQLKTLSFDNKTVSMMTLTVLPFAAVTTLSISSLTSLKRLSKEAGAHFVKTSTGFAGGGATAEDVKLMKDTVGDQ